MTKSCCINLGTDVAAARLLCLHILQSHWHCALQWEFIQLTLLEVLERKFPLTIPKEHQHRPEAQNSQ